VALISGMERNIGWNQPKVKVFALIMEAAPKTGVRSGLSAELGAGTTAFTDPNAEGLEPATRQLWALVVARKIGFLLANSIAFARDYLRLFTPYRWSIGGWLFGCRTQVRIVAAKMSQRAMNDVVQSRNSDSIHHCGRSIFYAIFGRVENMLIATVLFIAAVVAAGAAIVKAYEWHQDVLYGPYLKPMDWPQ
jgi:hypothetical protein